MIKEMTPEEWEVNKSCVLKKREHKWHWIPDGAPANADLGPVNAQCAHCGAYTWLERKTVDGYDELGIPRK